MNTRPMGMNLVGRTQGQTFRRRPHDDHGDGGHGHRAVDASAAGQHDDGERRSDTAKRSRIWESEAMQGMHHEHADARPPKVQRSFSSPTDGQIELTDRRFIPT